LAAWVFAGVLFLSAAAARAQQFLESDKPPEHVPAFPYAVALLSTIVVLVVICYPSRKA
jgi:hypothetical protein